MGTGGRNWVALAYLRLPPKPKITQEIHFLAVQLPQPIIQVKPFLSCAKMSEFPPIVRMMNGLEGRGKEHQAKCWDDTIT